MGLSSAAARLVIISTRGRWRPFSRLIRCWRLVPTSSASLSREIPWLLRCRLIRAPIIFRGASRSSSRVSVAAMCVKLLPHVKHTCQIWGTSRDARLRRSYGPLLTLDDFLTLTLPDRIAWLHGPDGPQGKLSHDRFAAILGTSRQTVIGWERAGGPEPQAKYRMALAEVSGFPAEAFSRRLAEALVAETVGSRLRSLEDQAVRVVDLQPVLRVLQLLATGKRSEALRVLTEEVAL